MAQRRMFSPDIVESDAFLEMPISSQALYFHLGMFADDDGFVNPKKIMRMIGVADDDLKVLIGKRFVLVFENGVIVIKHWKINNLIRKDWYRPTQYIEQKNTLEIKENGSYTEINRVRQQFVNDSSTEDRLGKDRLGKDRLSCETSFSPEGAKIIEKFIKLSPSLKYGNKTQRKACDEMIEKFGLEKALAMVDKVLEAQQDRYAPRATTPYAMWQKIGDFAVYFNKNSNLTAKI